MSHYGFELRAGLLSTYGGKPKKPPTTPKPSSAPAAKPIPKQPVPKGVSDE